jgi:heme exporter protein CcmD
MSSHISNFLAMGGYAVYVWPCYGLTAAVVGLNILWARRSLRLAQCDARRRLAALKLAASP